MTPALPSMAEMSPSPSGTAGEQIQGTLADVHFSINGAGFGIFLSVTAINERQSCAPEFIGSLR